MNQQQPRTQKRLKRAVGQIKTAINNAEQVVKTGKRQPRRARTNRNQAPRRSGWVNVPDTAHTQGLVKTIPRPLTRRLTARVQSVSDSLLENGTESMLQTLFSGVGGISRGICNGIEPSAICRIRGCVDVSIPISNYFSIAWVPSAITSANWITYAVDTTVHSPYGTGTSSIVGPFQSTNPCNAWRVVRACLRIINTTAVLSQGGVATASYIPSLYIGNPATGTLQPTYTFTNLQNFSMTRDYKGNDDIVLQWVPSSDEMLLQPFSWHLSTSTSLSGFGIIFDSLTATQGYRIEWDVGIEYQPTDTYRPYVDRKMPNVAVSSVQAVNTFVGNEWDKSVLTTKKQYDAMTSLLDPFEHHHTTSYQMATQAGMPSYALPADQPGYLSKISNKISEACTAAELASGYDICGAATSIPGKIAQTMLNQNYAAPMRIML